MAYLPFEENERRLERIAQIPNIYQAIRACIVEAGLQNKYVASVLHIDPGHFSKILKGLTAFPLDKFELLFQICGNMVPLEWLAFSQGFGLHALPNQSQEKIKELEQKNQYLTNKLAAYEDVFKLMGAKIELDKIIRQA